MSFLDFNRLPKIGTRQIGAAQRKMNTMDFILTIAPATAYSASDYMYPILHIRGEL